MLMSVLYIRICAHCVCFVYVLWTVQQMYLPDVNVLLFTCLLIILEVLIGTCFDGQEQTMCSTLFSCIDCVQIVLELH